MTEKCNCVFQEHCDAVRAKKRNQKEDLILLFHRYGLDKELIAASGIVFPQDEREKASWLGDKEFSKIRSHWQDELIVHRWSQKRSLQALLYLVEIKDAEIARVDAISEHAQATCNGPVTAETSFPICTSPIAQMQDLQVIDR